MSAVAIAGVVVYDRLAPRPAAAETSAAPTPVEGWEDMLTQARWIGNRGAKVTILEFSDFECPFCAQFHKELEPLLLKYPNDVALALVHYPLPMHRQAVVAASAADCAGKQDRLGEMTNALFASQDSLGLLPWARLATSARVPDTTLFAKCMRDTDLQQLANDSRDFAAKHKVSATPTVVVNGWRFPSPPSHATLARLTEDILAGRPVFNH